MTVENTAASSVALEGKQDSNAQIIATVFITFVAYLTIGLPLAVLPGHVHLDLGYSTVIAGFVISIQYAATVLSRARVGQIADTRGPKLAVLWGLAACFCSGLLLLVSAFLHQGAGLSFVLASRLSLGVGESLVGTGAIAWAIGRVGADKTARIIAWNGVSTYGGIAAGAPIGVYLVNLLGFASIGISVMVLALAGLVIAWPKPATRRIASEERLGFRHVLRRVMPHGIALGLATAGFGTITTFVTLFYASRNWDGAAFALTTFGVCFIICRLIFADMINRLGGFPVAIVSLALQVAGLLLLWSAMSPSVALAATGLTGFGFSLVFPAIGVEAVARVPSANRGSALGLYSMFLDVSLGLVGPAAGWIAGSFTAATPFLFGAIATLCGLGVTVILALKR